MRKLISLIYMLLPVFAFAQEDFCLDMADRMFPHSFEAVDHEKPCLSILEDYSPGCTKIGRHCLGRQAKLGDTAYDRVIGVNSPSRIRVSLDKPVSMLTGKYGLDVQMGAPSSVEFVVQVTGKEIFRSPVIRPDNKAYDLRLDMGGATQFDLVVTPGPDNPGFDQADWADLKVEYTDGTSEYINDICSDLELKGFPFSFKYGDKESAAILPEWKYEVSDEKKEDRIVRTAIYSDPLTKLEIRAVVNIYTRASGIDYTLYVRNAGSSDTPVISDFRALDLIMSPVDADMSSVRYAAPDYVEAQSQPSLPVLHRLRGTEGYKYFCKDDFMPIENVLSDSESVTFGSEDAYPSCGAFPFYHLTYRGGGVVTALGWSGKWESCISYDDGKIRSQAGMADFHTYLKPGEEIRSPRILLTFYKGADAAKGTNLFRQTMLTYVVPRYDGKIQEAPIAHMSSCNHQDNNTNAAIEKSYIDAIYDNKLDFDLYWLDAWWHKGGFPKGLGNYVYPIETSVDFERFPGGVLDVSQYAKQRGLKFLCWFCPESLSEGSLIARDHPDWIFPQSGPFGHNLNLGNPEALEYTIKFMNDCIREWSVDVWRTDVGYTLDGIKRIEKNTPDRQGILEIRQVEGLYKLWDALREGNPGLMIDNCCSGGSRIDLETSSRSISFWRTDNGVWAGGRGNYKDMAILNQNNNVCLNQYIPQSLCACMGNMPYYFRSGFNYGLVFDDDNRSPEYDNKLVAEGISELRRLRKYVFGDFYPLIFHSYGYDEWCAYQYDRPQEGDGCVFVFRRDESPVITTELSLKGIDAGSKYKVTVYGESYTRSRTFRMKGSDLQKLQVSIDSRPASALVEYKKIR